MAIRPVCVSECVCHMVISLADKILPHPRHMLVGYGCCHYMLEEPVMKILYGAKEYEPNVGGWPWQILGVIRAVATV